MDFDNILNIASQNQGLGSVQKRYSLQVGPPKKDPKSKGVNPAAVRALLKKQQCETQKKELHLKKQKEELLAKRVELKSDRKARAMASRTKDNFKGYNGVPVVDVPKKRTSKQDIEQNSSPTSHGFRNTSLDPEDDEDNYEYESDPEPLRPGKSVRECGSDSSKAFSKKPKSAPSPMNFADLLKLAEKKQFEPVDLKPKVVKKEERLRTADEIKELEMERKAKRPDKNRDSKMERDRDSKSQSSSSSTKASTLEKEQKNCKIQKNLAEKQTLPSGSGKKLQSVKGHLSSKSSVDRDKERPKPSHSDRDRPKANLNTSSSAMNSKVLSKTTSSQVSVKQGAAKPSSVLKSSTSSDLSYKKESSSLLQERASGIPGTKPPGTGQKFQHGSSQQTRPTQGSFLKQGATVEGHKSGKREPLKSGINSEVKSSGNSVIRNSLGGSSKAGGQPLSRPGPTIQAKAGSASQSRPGKSGLQSHPGVNGPRPPGIVCGQSGRGGPVPGRSTGIMRPGPERPKCTVVSETISSKNVGGPRPGIPPRPGMPQRPGMPPRPGMPARPGIPARPGMPPRPPMNRPPGTMLPPITSAYKRKYEDEEEDDSEMDDFIDDGDDEPEEISRHIKEIFGYDRNKYKDESDYALKFMESSWKDVQKEEARSLRLAVQEDLDEEKREEEELKRKNAKRRKT